MLRTSGSLEKRYTVFITITLLLDYNYGHFIFELNSRNAQITCNINYCTKLVIVKPLGSDTNPIYIIGAYKLS